MSISVGGINLVNEIIDLRYQLIRTQLLLEMISVKSDVQLSINDVKKADEKAVELLNKKYPQIRANVT